MEKESRDEKRERLEQIKERIRIQLRDRSQVDDDVLYACIEEAVEEEARARYLPLAGRLELRNRLVNAFRRLDILQELVDNPEITEIMINGKDQIFVEQHGRISRWEEGFDSNQQLEDMIQQIVSRINRAVNVANPIADARLPDGSRVHIVLPPIALDGPVVTIRKFPEPITVQRLLELGSLSEEAVEFLKKLVCAGYNIFICGGTGSGKTSFLNAMSAFIPETDRIVTIEDSAELQIRQVPNLVRLETRNANAEGEGAIEISDLIRASLRMRPDRIIVGEVRGKECLDMLQALNTGHAGSLSTGHGNSPKDMLSRLETMTLMAGELPLMAVRSQIASALDIMVHLGRLRDKSRKVLEIVEVGDFENGEIQLNPLFRFEEESDEDQKKRDEGRRREKVKGSLVKVGSLRSVEKLRQAGYPV
ncbi:CpaF family protein [Brotaphodocola catenula]|uniref:CpaF family protein n=2 Tax=Brotaphodocola catenula TaxID=2885361 RepID=A0AAE3AKB3_9FIRM|nr:CpaF family protein [Brotaphodocola catenula]MCC2163333.1 CpaF family protein [Brotaphodocola catenula]